MPDRGYSVREPLPLPTKGPFTVHLGNMSFDATEGDVMDFFSECEVTSVRIVEDKLDKKPKGFAYAEFKTVDGLKRALDFNGAQFQGRNIRVSVAEPRTRPCFPAVVAELTCPTEKDRAETREFNDWTRKGPLPDLGPRRTTTERTPFSGRNADHMSDSGSERAGRKFGFEQGDGKTRDFSNWERKGPLPSTTPAAAPPRSTERPQSREGFRDRRASPAWGEGRSQDGSRPPRREFAERPAPERAPTAADMDTQWRLKMRPDAAPPVAAPSGPENPQATSPASPGAASAAQKLTSRPKLNLAKRTVSQAESPVQATSADPKVSPFGAARPIDTTAREKEIEDKIRQRKEQDEKLREEKRAADEKAKDERRQAKELERTEKSKGKANGNPKDTDSALGSNKNYQILRRDANEDKNSIGDKEENQEVANGLHAQEERGVAAKIGDSKEAEDTTTESGSAPPQEEDGWSTVSKPTKKGRGGYSGGRVAL